MEIVYKKVNELIPYDNNPRINDEAVEYVKNSIKEFGFKVPIVIDKDNVIIAGHTRIKASKELGIKDIPCIIADDLTEEQVKAFRLADNKVAEKSMWDYSKLDEELDSILDIDMSMFDFENIEETNLDDFFEESGEKEKEKKDYNLSTLWKGNRTVMKICLAGTTVLEANKNIIQKSKYILESFYSIKDWQIPIIKKCDLFLLDSGAFTFMNSYKGEVNLWFINKCF